MNYTDNCSYSVSRMTDDALADFLKAIVTEQTVREKKKAIKRKEWIDEWYTEFMNRYDTVSITRGELTIVATFDEYNGQRIGTAYPVKGDKFDSKTGIAVAYAKAIGIAIPDYI